MSSGCGKRDSNTRANNEFACVPYACAEKRQEREIVGEKKGLKHAHHDIH